MLWQRALVDQEVLELYFFPLLRSMSKIKPEDFLLNIWIKCKSTKYGYL